RTLKPLVVAGAADQHRTGLAELRECIPHAVIESPDPSRHLAVEPRRVLEELHDVGRRSLARRDLYEDRAATRYERTDLAAAKEVFDDALLELWSQRAQLSFDQHPRVGAEDMRPTERLQLLVGRKRRLALPVDPARRRVCLL